jgi:hypothetical protein
VLGRVAGRGDRAKHRTVYLDLLLVIYGEVIELNGYRPRHDDGRSHCRELEVPRNEVVMQVRVHHESEPESSLLCVPEQPTGVSGRIDGDRVTVAEIDQVAGVAQTLVDDRRDAGPSQLGHRMLRSPAGRITRSVSSAPTTKIAVAR